MATPSNTSPLLSLSFMRGVSREHMEEVLASVAGGAQTPAECVGMGDKELGAIEHIATGYFRAKQYEKAFQLFGLVLQLDVKRPRAWRGLGASAHAVRQYDMAATALALGLQYDPDDLIALVLLGETLCLRGDTDEGLQVLEAAVARKGGADVTARPYIVRAEGILRADGGLPPKVVIKQKGVAIAEQARREHLAAMGIEDDGKFRFQPDQELTAEMAGRHPELRKALENVSKLMADGILSIRDVAGFTNEQMDAALDVSIGYLQAGQYAECVQFNASILLLDPHHAGFHKVQGTCLFHMRQYAMACFHYRMATINDPDDPENFVFFGEARVMAGLVDEGVALIRQGRDMAQGKPEHAEVAQRANALLQQLGR